MTEYIEEEQNKSEHRKTNPKEPITEMLKTKRIDSERKNTAEENTEWLWIETQVDRKHKIGNINTEHKKNEYRESENDSKNWT